MTIVTDDYFSGLRCWGTQLLLSIISLQIATKEFIRPQRLFNESAATLAGWKLAGTELLLNVEFVYLQDLLISKTGVHRRVIAWTPLHALDLGVDRDLTATFSGFAIPTDLMQTQGLVSLEERTAYLIQAKMVRNSLIYEWNLFADIQQSLWLTILDEESDGQLFTDGQAYGRQFFSPTSAFDADISTLIPLPAYIRGVSRANYDEVITQWLLDSGTTARSGGIAISNDSYVEWLESQMLSCPANTSLIPKHSIDPRDVYKFAPMPEVLSDGDGSDGVSGTPDSGNADPANDEQSKALDLLEELESRGGGLIAELGTSTAKNIDTLPEC